MRQVFAGIIASLFIVFHAVAADQVPDATIELSGGSVAIGIGYSWGSGHLVFQGKVYQLNVSGLSVANVGVSDYTASGEVYNLKQAGDIAGNFTAASAGITVAGGASATILKNQNGVTIRMTSTSQGLQFTLAAEGVKISLAN